MTLFENISFEDPWWLLLFVLLPLVWWLNSRYVREVADYAPVTIPSNQRPVGDWRSWTAGRLHWLWIVALALAIIAMARPQRVLVEEEYKVDGIDIFLAIDLSSSMLSRDFSPDRLSVAKQVAIEFVNKRQHDRIGLVSFAGEAFTQSPLTTDHDVLDKALSELHIGYLNDGTAIGMGLATAVNRLKDSEAESKVIILLTDGVNNAGFIDPMTAAELAKTYHIKLYTIGIGSMGRALSPIGRTRNGQYQYAMARVEIDDQLLTRIAEMTGGLYYRAVDAEQLKLIYEKIDELEKSEIEVTVLRRVTEYFRPFLIGSLLSMFVYFIVRYVWLKIWPD